MGLQNSSGNAIYDPLLYLLTGFRHYLRLPLIPRQSREIVFAHPPPAAIPLFKLLMYLSLLPSRIR